MGCGANQETGNKYVQVVALHVLSDECKILRLLPQPIDAT